MTPTAIQQAVLMINLRSFRGTACGHRDRRRIPTAAQYTRIPARMRLHAQRTAEKPGIYNPVTKATTSEPNTPEGLRKAARKAKAVVCSEPTGGLT